MQKNILEYLDKTALSHADKTAFGDEREEMTFGELKKDADAIASRLLELEAIRRPVAVYLPKSCDSIRSFIGIAGSGGFYCPVDTAMPPDRASAILNILKPAAVITSKKYEEKLNKLGLQINIVRIEDAKDTPIQTEQLQNVRERLLDLDPLYVLFTSGSTGIPKGVLISHRAVIDYIDWVTETFDITDKDTFGNQAPFYFDNSILDIYCALKNGSAVYIIPQRKFLFPADLISLCGSQFKGAGAGRATLFKKGTFLWRGHAEQAAERVEKGDSRRSVCQFVRAYRDNGCMYLLHYRQGISR